MGLVKLRVEFTALCRRRARSQLHSLVEKGNTGTLPSLTKGINLLHALGMHKRDLRCEARLRRTRK